LKSLNQFGVTFQHASQELKNDKEFVKKAMKKAERTLEFVSENLK
jgi:hypothetical protein